MFLNSYRSCLLVAHSLGITRLLLRDTGVKTRGETTDFIAGSLLLEDYMKEGRWGKKRGCLPIPQKNLPQSSCGRETKVLPSKTMLSPRAASKENRSKKVGMEKK